MTYARCFAIRTDRPFAMTATPSISSARRSPSVAIWSCCPVERLSNDFFQLKTRILGDVIQKFVNYERRLVILGDINRHLEASKALRDFVYETNRGRQVWFVADRAALESRLQSG